MAGTLSRRQFLALAGGAAFSGIALVPGGRHGANAAPATPSDGSPVPSTDEQTLVLRIDTQGGFVPVDYNLTRMPMVSVYADGTVITTGPTIEIYPSPALPNLRALVLTESGLANVISAAVAAGLPAEGRLAGPNVTDLPDTVFTFVQDGVTSITAAYALGFNEDSIPDAALRAARQQLIDLQSMLVDLTGTLSPDDIAVADHAYEIDRLLVYARPIDSANPPSPDLPQQPVDWPLASDLATFGTEGSASSFGLAGMRCGAITGEDAATLLAALRNANQLTPWVSNGVNYLLWVRPLLPDEPSTCP